MIICSASTFSANAVMAEENDTVIEATVNLGNENELQPMATSGCENDYHHIFDNPQHNLAPFLNSYGGNQAAAYGAVLSAGQSYVTVARISGEINAYNQITVSVNGFNITIRGNVINGCLHIGTFLSNEADSMLFEQFEYDIIMTISEELPAYKNLMIEQYADSIKKREFTGRGFFTYFENVTEGLIVDAGFKQELGMLTATLNDVCEVGFALFIRDGRISCLEGYTFGDAWPDVINTYSIKPNSVQIM